MKDGETTHLKKDKLAEKLGRRGIKFYDLYKFHKEDKDVRMLNDSGFKLHGIMEVDGTDEEPIFGDLEVDDFNQLYTNQDLIRQQFGETIRVKLTIQERTGDVERTVEDDLDKAVPMEANAGGAGGEHQSQQVDTYDPKDGELVTLRNRLDRLVGETKRDIEEVADPFVRFSGDFDRIKKFFNNPAIGWSEIEDLALAKPEDSPEF